MKTTFSAIVLLFVSFLITPRDCPAQTMLNLRAPSLDENRLLAEFNSARLSGDKNKIQEIQHQLDNVTGSVTAPSGNSIGTFVDVNSIVPPFNTDNINIVQISALKGIRAFATATEQRGQNSGRVWVVAAVSNTSDADTIYYFYSDNGGTVWNLYTSLHFSNSYQVNYDQMDVEIIEDNIGDKYIWTVYGLNAPNGKQFISASVIRSPNFQGNAFICSWPGENLSNTNFGRFRPRITSDNAKYSNTASIYISVSTDTLVSAGVYKGWYNYVLCVNPYTVNPVLDYYGRGIVIYSSSSPTDLHSDIAYVYNNGDSIIMVSSNNYKYPEQIGISVVNNHFGGLNGQAYDNGNTFEKGFTRIACSGGTNQLTSMIVYRENYQNSGDWDIRAYKSTSSLYSWQTIDIDVRRDNVLVPNPPDICGVRNKENRYYISYTNSGLSNYDTVKYLFTSQSTSTISFRTVSHLNAFARPKPGFRLVNNDSCLGVWSQKGSGGGDNIWVSEGCN